MEPEYVALVSTCKEAEWLKNLLHKIPMWPNRHHLLIHGEIVLKSSQKHTVIYTVANQGILIHVVVMEDNLSKMVIVDCVHSSQNLADPLTKGLVRDLVIITTWIGLKSISKIVIVETHLMFDGNI